MGYKCMVRVEIDDQDVTEFMLLQHSGPIGALYTKFKARVSHKLGWLLQHGHMLEPCDEVVSFGTFRDEWKHVRLR